MNTDRVISSHTGAERTAGVLAVRSSAAFRPRRGRLFSSMCRGSTAGLYSVWLVLQGFAFPPQLDYLLEGDTLVSIPCRTIEESQQTKTIQETLETKHDSWTSWNWTQWNGKTQRMFERRKMTRRLKLLFSIDFRVRRCLLQVGCSHDNRDKKNEAVCVGVPLVEIQTAWSLWSDSAPLWLSTHTPRLSLRSIWLVAEILNTKHETKTQVR